jgi:hypothetical protein
MAMAAPARWAAGPPGEARRACVGSISARAGPAGSIRARPERTRYTRGMDMGGHRRMPAAMSAAATASRAGPGSARPPIVASNPRPTHAATAARAARARASARPPCWHCSAREDGRRSDGSGGGGGGGAGRRGGEEKLDDVCVAVHEGRAHGRLG